MRAAQDRSRATSALVVLVTCPSRRHAKQLAHALVERRLAACVTIMPSVDSLFWWRGRVDRAREALLIVKTAAAQFQRLRAAVRSSHPYDVPEIIAWPMTHAHPPYLAWLHHSLRVPSK